LVLKGHSLFQGIFVNRVQGHSHEAAQHRLKNVQRQSVVIPIKSRIVIRGNELLRAGVMGMVLEHIPHMAVHSDVMEKVVPLKNGMQQSTDHIS
jgi:hypothetical protein